MSPSVPTWAGSDDRRRRRRAAGWVYYPIQTFKAFGGLELHTIPSVILDGTLCTFGVTRLEGLGPDGEQAFSDVNPDGCNWSFPLLFFSYCAVDYCTYAMGLYVIQRGGANLMILASAISLPLTQLTLCVGFLMGPFAQARAKAGPTPPPAAALPPPLCSACTHGEPEASPRGHCQRLIKIVRPRRFLRLPVSTYLSTSVRPCLCHLRSAPLPSLCPLPVPPSPPSAALPGGLVPTRPSFGRTRSPSRSASAVSGCTRSAVPRASRCSRGSEGRPAGGRGG